MRRFLLLMAVAGLGAPVAAQAIPVNLFHSLSDDAALPGSGANTGCPGAPITPVCLTEGVHTLNLWADPTAAGGGGVFGIQDVLLEATGSITVVGFDCDTGADCLEGAPSDPSRQVFFTAGDDIDGDFAPFEIGTVVLNVAAGLGVFQLAAGTALDGNFVGGSIDRPVVVAHTPEPGTGLLIGVGMLGLAGGGRRRRAADVYGGALTVSAKGSLESSR